uniref:Uncharacterized protein n=1 Tax=Rhizophora mucronata TaxID=61149 RepID=A0A2P2PS71_RHIMU
MEQEYPDPIIKLLTASNEPFVLFFFPSVSESTAKNEQKYKRR